MKVDWTEWVTFLYAVSVSLSQWWRWSLGMQRGSSVNFRSFSWGRSTRAARLRGGTTASCGARPLTTSTKMGSMASAPMNVSYPMVRVRLRWTVLPGLRHRYVDKISEHLFQLWVKGFQIATKNKHLPQSPLFWSACFQSPLPIVKKNSIN